jgi:hypothetical protein
VEAVMPAVALHLTVALAPAGLVIIGTVELGAARVPASPLTATLLPLHTYANERHETTERFPLFHVRIPDRPLCSDGSGSKHPSSECSTLDPRSWAPPCLEGTTVFGFQVPCELVPLSWLVLLPCLQGKGSISNAFACRSQISA